MDIRTELACCHCGYRDHASRQCPEFRPGECTKPRCSKRAAGPALACSCGRTFHFCVEHGAGEAATRSMGSHMGLHHPKAGR